MDKRDLLKTQPWMMFWWMSYLIPKCQDDSGKEDGVTASDEYGIMLDSRRNMPGDGSIGKESARTSLKLAQATEETWNARKAKAAQYSSIVLRMKSQKNQCRNFDSPVVRTM
jgi:hypothetical protein